MLLLFNPMHLKTCNKSTHTYICVSHDDVIKWKHFPRYWPFVRGIHRSPVNSPHKGQWHGALMVPLVCAWINGWANNLKAGDLRRHRAHYDVIAMCVCVFSLYRTILLLGSRKRWPKSVDLCSIVKKDVLLHWENPCCWTRWVSHCYWTLFPSCITTTS